MYLLWAALSFYALPSSPAWPPQPTAYTNNIRFSSQIQWYSTQNTRQLCEFALRSSFAVPGSPPTPPGNTSTRPKHVRPSSLPFLSMTCKWITLQLLPWQQQCNAEGTHAKHLSTDKLMLHLCPALPGSSQHMGCVGQVTAQQMEQSPAVNTSPHMRTGRSCKC